MVNSLLETAGPRFESQFCFLPVPLWKAANGTYTYLDSYHQFGGLLELISQFLASPWHCSGCWGMRGMNQHMGDLCLSAIQISKNHYLKKYCTQLKFLLLKKHIKLWMLMHRVWQNFSVYIWHCCITSSENQEYFC